MSNRQQPLPEHPSTYVVADRSNQEELHRLHLRDQMLTESQGGVLPEQPDPTSFQRVLDVSRTFVEYARAQAEAGQVSDRVEFQVMDALRMLEFPTGFFDLVNQRLGQSWLRTWDWPKLLQEYQRVARVGGVVRIVESGATKTSPALTRFSELVLTALYQSGHYFAPDWTGVTNQLTRLLHQHGLQQVQVHEAALAYRAGTPRGHLYMEDVRRSLNTLQPFLEKWTRVPADYQALCSQVESEIQQPDFVATLQMLTAWGKVPSRKKEREDSPR